MTVGGRGRRRHARRRGARGSWRASCASRSSSPVAVDARQADVQPLRATTPSVHADVGGMVDEALAASRSGNIVSRVARDLTGGEEDAQVAPRVSYSKAAVGGLVERVVAKVDRPAQDAKVDFPSLDQVKEQHGLKVDAATLRAARGAGAERARSGPPRRGAGRPHQAQGHARAAGRQVPDAAGGRPRQLQAAPLQEAPAGQDRTRWPSAPWASTPRRGCTTSRTRRSTRPGACPTATGRAISPARSSRAARPTTRSRRAGWASTTAPGIHGTDQTYSLGSAASHGCIRMAIPDVIELYDQVPVGAPIYIA